MASQPQATTGEKGGVKSDAEKGREVEGKENKDAVANEAEGEELRFSPEEEAVCHQRYSNPISLIYLQQPVSPF